MMISNLFRRIRAFISFRIRQLLVKILPLQKNMILLDNFDGKGFGDNPKYIAIYIHEHKLPFKLYWRVRDKTYEAGLPEYIVPVIQNSIKDYVLLRIAHFYINNYRAYIADDRKRQQYNIMTWHAIYGVKYAEKAVEDQLDPNYVAIAKAHSLKADLFLTASNWQEIDYQRSFWYNGEIMRSGYPRDDIYFSKDPNIKKRIRQRLNIHEGDRILIYAPTFRDSGDTSIYHIPVEDILKALKDRTSCSWTMIVRLHPNVSLEVKNKFHYNEHVIEATTYPDPQDLLYISDLLISDYSSTTFDFIVQNKPVILYAPDYGKSDLRSLQPMFKYLPFDHCYNTKELIKAIRNFDKEEILNRLSQFLGNYTGEMGQLFKSYDDGHASERVVNRLIQIQKGEFKPNQVK